MFTGDEVGNDPSLDISKVQLYFFTIVIVLAYATGLGELCLTDTGLVEGLPELSESILILLAISHTGYLWATKASPIVQTPPPAHEFPTWWG